MGKRLLKRTKALAVAGSAALFATAFTPGGCTISVDQDLLNELGGILTTLEAELPGGWATDDGDWLGPGGGECDGDWGE